jgi:hypothetical protein
MDRLGTCMDALRVLARSNDPDRAALVEGHIDAYLTTETVSVWQALERLCKGIRDEQAEGREGENWSIAKGYIRSVLYGLAWRTAPRIRSLSVKATGHAAQCRNGSITQRLTRMMRR